MYLVTCTHCKDSKVYKHRLEFNTERCNSCNGLKFGLKDYHWVTKQEAK